MIASTRKSERAGSGGRRSAGLSTLVASFALAVLIAGVGFAGCGSDNTTTPTAGSGGSGPAAAGTGGGTTGATFTQVLAIFGGTANCGICHASPPSSGFGGLQFNSAMKDQAYNALVGPSSTGTNGSKCGSGKKYVVPGNPAGSLLYGKLMAPPPCGVQMPMGGTPLSADQLATVNSWIMAGAKNN
jgi:hypothetical protein